MDKSRNQYIRGTAQVEQFGDNMVVMLDMQRGDMIGEDTRDRKTDCWDGP